MASVAPIYVLYTPSISCRQHFEIHLSAEGSDTLSYSNMKCGGVVSGIRRWVGWGGMTGSTIKVVDNHVGKHSPCKRSIKLQSLSVWLSTICQCTAWTHTRERFNWSRVCLLNYSATGGTFILTIHTKNIFWHFHDWLTGCDLWPFDFDTDINSRA